MNDKKIKNEHGHGRSKRERSPNAPYIKPEPTDDDDFAPMKRDIKRRRMSSVVLKKEDIAQDTSVQMHHSRGDELSNSSPTLRMRTMLAEAWEEMLR